MINIEKKICLKPFSKNQSMETSVIIFFLKRSKENNLNLSNFARRERNGVALKKLKKLNNLYFVYLVFLNWVFGCPANQIKMFVKHQETRLKLDKISSRINFDHFRNTVDFEEWTNGTDYTLDGDCGGVTCKKNRSNQ
jgi:hypothetical protein